jgi:hypothetical protein
VLEGRDLREEVVGEFVEELLADTAVFAWEMREVSFSSEKNEPNELVLFIPRTEGEFCVEFSVSGAVACARVSLEVASFVAISLNLRLLRSRDIISS